MLKIRLKRTGRKHDPSYRLIVVESTRGPKSGDYIENLGLYDPRRDVKQIDVDRAKHWVSQGAQASDTAHNLLVELGAIEGEKINVLPQKSPVKNESEEAEKEAAAPAETPAEGESEESAEEEAEAEEPKAEAEPAPETEEAAAEEKAE